MAAEGHKALIRRFVDTVWNGKNVDAFAEFHASPFTQNGESRTPEEVAEALRGVLATAADYHQTIEDIITEGDKVAYRWLMRSTNRATGKPQVFRGITFMRIADGKIVEDWFSAEQIEE